jgi:hypothetical protein
LALEGTLQLFSLPDVFKMISAQKKTGILTIQGEQDIIAISFLTGEVVAADALNQTVEDGLGQVLISQGLVEPERFASLAAEHHAGNARLIDLLVQRGVLDRRQLLEALRHQTYQLLLQVLGWRVGEFKFYGGDEVSFEEGLAPISVEEVFVRASTDLGPASGVSGKLPGATDIFARSAHADAQIGTDGGVSLPDGMGPLTAEEEGLLAMLDGRRTVADLAETTGLGPYKVRYALYRLVEGSLARSLFETPGMARAGAEPAAVLTPLPVAPPLEAVRPVRAAGAAWDKPATKSLFAGVLGTIAAALLLGFYLRPHATPLLPFPWQEPQRKILVGAQRDALYLKIDRAARTYFLLEANYPESLKVLVGMGLLRSADLRDPEGRELAYAPAEVHYDVAPLDDRGARIEPEGLAEAISGDFLVDPEFIEAPEKTEQAPLVLLD